MGVVGVGAAAPPAAVAMRHLAAAVMPDLVLAAVTQHSVGERLLPLPRPVSATVMAAMAITVTAIAAAMAASMRSAAQLITATTIATGAGCAVWSRRRTA